MTTILLVAPCVVTLLAYLLAWVLVTGRVVTDRRTADTIALVESTEPLPGLSVLKPLCGSDEELEANLRSFLEADHEPLQIIFAAASPTDPAITLARRLAAAYPHRDVTVVVGADDTIANPKIALMEAMLPEAKHDILLLSDSNVRLSRGDLASVLPLFAEPRIGMAYQPVVADGERTVAATIENLHYTEFAAFLTIGVHELVGLHTVNAKGQWVRRAALEAAGGFERVRDCGADDYELSQQVERSGWKLAPSATVVRVIQREWSWKNLADRNLRHAGLRVRICPWAYPLELLFNPIPFALPLIVAGRIDLAALGAFAIGAKVAMELSSARLLRGRGLAWRLVPALIAKDLFIFACWFIAPLRRTAEWRGRPYRLLPGGRIAPVAGETRGLPIPLETA
jgi:ceramide glucosyltransferase